MSELRKIITVDGLAASGKTTLAKQLADKLGFKHFNSGSIYRAFAYGYQKKFGDFNPQLALTYAQTCSLSLLPDSSIEIDGEILLHQNQDMLTSAKISDLTSQLSAIPEVRTTLYQVQRQAYLSENIVAEGRDQGTIVFPESLAKFFIIASAEVRAQRRKTQQPNLNENELTKELSERDKRDSLRTIAPTVPAHDAIIIENNTADPDSVVLKMESFVLSKLNSLK